MKCKFDPVRMAAVVRLLSGGSHAAITSEEATREKIAEHTLNREFREANEANLLEEKDMNIFGCRPLADPLYLVLCNTCKKPVKASQFAIHAEWCTTSNNLQEIGVEPDVGVGNKKTLKKGRKKLQNGHYNQGMTNGQVQNFDSVDGHFGSLGLNLSKQYETISGPSEEEKGFASANCLKVDNSGVHHDCIHLKPGAPAPLATKMYYSRGNHRLRAAISHLYYQSVSDNVYSKPVPMLVQDKVIASSGISPNKILNSMNKDNTPQQKVNSQFP